MGNKALPALAGGGTFLVWLWLVGNPHVVETVIGVVLAVAVAIATFRWLSRRST